MTTTVKFTHKEFDRVLVLTPRDRQYGQLVPLDLTRYQPPPNIWYGDICLQAEGGMGWRRIPLSCVLFVNRKGQLVWPKVVLERKDLAEVKARVAVLRKALKLR